MRTFQNNLIQSFQQYPGVNSQVGTAYTVQLSDYGQLVVFNNGSAVTVSLPTANTTGFCPFSVFMSNLGLGIVTVTPVSGTIGGAANYTIPTNAGVYIVSDGTNWQIINFKVASVTINGAAQNSIGYYANTGTTISGIAPANNSVLVTSGSGVPSESTTLPSGLTIPGPTFSGIVTGPDGGSWASSGFTASNLATSGIITFGVLSPTSFAGSATTVTGLTTNNSPNASADYIPYFNNASGLIEKATVGSIASSATAGVSSLKGLSPAP